MSKEKISREITKEAVTRTKDTLMRIIQEGTGDLKRGVGVWKNTRAQKRSVKFRAKRINCSLVGR